MQLGAMSFITDQSMHPGDLARAIEDRGLDSFWVPEKTHVPLSRRTPWPGGDLPEQYRRCYDPFVALATAAAVTNRIRIGTGVCLLALHDPIVLAKTIASLDHASGGRFQFGVGYGWNAEELESHGVAIGDAREILIDKLALMTALWTNPEGGYAGPHCHVEPCSARPRPIQQPRPPVLFGGIASDRVFDDVISHADGWMPIEHFGWDIEDVARLRHQAEDAGRDPAEIRVVVYSATPDPALADSYAAVGIDEIVYSLPPTAIDMVEPVLDAAAAIAASHAVAAKEHHS